MKLRIQKIFLLYGWAVRLVFLMFFLAFAYAIKNGDLQNTVRILEVANKALELIVNAGV